MENNSIFSALCISSSKGGGGKSLLTLGLGRVLSKRGWMVKPFKKGPDYIDSAWLSKACGMPATNLDPFFMEAEQLQKFFLKSLAHCKHANSSKNLLALLEGNRGLYDGLDETGSCSTAYLAKLLKCPILLCLDSEKCTRTMAAIIKGLTSFESELTFTGVVLNRVGSARHAEALRKTIEYNTDIKVLGILPRMGQNPLPERHMGLASFGPDLQFNSDRVLDGLATFIADNCNIAAILSSLPSFNFPDENIFKEQGRSFKYDLSSKKSPRPRIGYIKDAALWFYYPENLSALENAGAELVPLKIIAPQPVEENLWDSIDALYLGGGFPEDFVQELENSHLLERLANFARAGMPIYAECGGMMLLCEKLRIGDKSWKMAGIFPNVVKFQNRPQGLGYVEARVVKHNPYFPINTRLKGHEFHYSACAENNEDSFALRLTRGTGMGKRDNIAEAIDGLLFKNVWASYTHIFAPAIPCWAINFVWIAKNWRNNVVSK